MIETLAATIIHLSGWQGEKPLYDPFCGAGTLLCEALMTFSRIPAGFLRKNFGFKYLPDFDISAWEAVQKEAKSDLRLLPENLISGSDISGRAVKNAIANVNHLPGGDQIRITTKSFAEIESLEIRSLSVIRHTASGKERRRRCRPCTPISAISSNRDAQVRSLMST
jgi:putative N6-adenine-specific DNA methylase